MSSGQQHRKTESEWVPVSPKKVEAVPAAVVPVAPVSSVAPVKHVQLKAIVALPPPPAVQVFPASVNLEV